MRNILLTAITMIVCSCNSPQKVDMIVTHAIVYTLNPKNEICQSFAVDKGKIIETGSIETIQNKYISDHVVDANNQPIYPGFIDAHCHFYGYAKYLRFPVLKGLKSFDEVIKTLKDFQELHQTEWIVGRGWDQNEWDSKAFPEKELLDNAFPGKPVVLTRIDGHAVIASSEAIRRAGITLNSPIPDGQAIMKNGQFTGIFLESWADTLKNAIPEPSENEMTLFLKKAQENCFAVGLTSVTDAGLELKEILLLDKLQKQGIILMNIDAMVNPTHENLEYFVRHGIYKTPKMHIHAIKLYADGALGSRGAWLLKPYSDQPGWTGIPTLTQDSMDKWCKIALEYGYQVNTHAIGDAAVRFVLKSYSRFLKGKNDLRWRVEHSQVVNPDDVNLFGQFSIIPSVQATHATSDMNWAGLRLGKRVKNAYAYNSLMEQNGWIPNGTDFPIEQIDPLYTWYAASQRKDLNGNPASGFQFENALNPQQALLSITLWAARSNFEETIKGSIEPGKNADFIILDHDILNCKPEEVLSTKVISNYISGVQVFLVDN